MSMPDTRIEKSPSPPPLYIGDHLALDFVNSEIGGGPDRVECLNSDAQVIGWLRGAGLTAELPPRGQQGTLLNAALALRETARALLVHRKAGQAGDPSALNRVLTRGGGYGELAWKKTGAPEYLQRRRIACPEDLLVPVAEAIAELLAQGDFSLIRKCENPDCTLWFYDRTKSHHRRWCSMAVCGNRMKVAAFRARRKTE